MSTVNDDRSTDPRLSLISSSLESSRLSQFGFVALGSLSLFMRNRPYRNPIIYLL